MFGPHIFVLIAIYVILLIEHVGSDTITSTPPSDTNMATAFPPASWIGTCRFLFQDDNISVTVVCNVSRRQEVSWRLKDLRGALVNKTDVKVSIDLTCQTGGSISLPWPVRAPGLITLKIRNCRLLGEMSDGEENGEQWNNWLRELDLSDCTWVNRPIPSALDVLSCAQKERLSLLRLRNITSEVDSGHSVASLSESSTTKCNFSQLLTLDESMTYSLDENYLEDLIKNNLFPVLKTLNYSGVDMVEAPKELTQWKRYFPVLSTLDLSRNRLSKFPFVSFDSKLTVYVNLTDNNFTQLSLQMFQDWSQNGPSVIVDIHHNPILCDCQRYDFLQKLHQQNLWVGNVMSRYHEHVLNLTCASPSSVENRTLRSLRLIDDIPSCIVQPQDLRAAMAFLVTVAVLFLVLLVLALRYRREVRILVYTRVCVLLPFGLRPVKPKPQDKQYEAFVSYSNVDSDWVIHTLCSRLEKTSSSSQGLCRLCIHHRDFIVGKPIINNIIDSIAASKHTIVVLSPNYVRSSWAMEELQHAYRQSLEERRRHLIIVLLDDVDNIEMTPLLRRCRKTFTYLHVSDILFWDRLLYSLHVEEVRSDQPENCINSISDVIYDDIAHENETEVITYQHDAYGEIISPEMTLTVFPETMRSISADSTATTITVLSDDSGMPSSPSSILDLL